MRANTHNQSVRMCVCACQSLCPLLQSPTHNIAHYYPFAEEGTHVQARDHEQRAHNDYVQNVPHRRQVQQTLTLDLICGVRACLCFTRSVGVRRVEQSRAEQSTRTHTETPKGVCQASTRIARICNGIERMPAAGKEGGGKPTHSLTEFGEGIRDDKHVEQHLERKNRVVGTRHVPLQLHAQQHGESINGMCLCECNG